MPFTSSDDDVPWWVRDGVEDSALVPDEVPEIPADLLEAPLWEPPCECRHCAPPLTRDTDLYRVPDSLADEFTREWALVQRHTARAWQAAVAMHEHVRAERGPVAAEHVGADLALMMNVHPRTGELMMVTALRAGRDVPELATLVETGALSGKHVDALLDEVGRWTDTAEQAQEVIRLTLDRCRERAATHGWPTPGALRKRLRTAAMLLDLQAAERARKSVAERRGVALSPSAIGQAMLTVQGPEVAVVQMMDAIRARAEALGRLPGDSRTLDQRMFDAANELLCVDADGGHSQRPATGQDGEPVTLVVRGVEIAVLVPYSILEGGNHELAEIPGYGPILPSTARELAAQAEHLRRVAVDAASGQVLAVDDRLPGPVRKPASDASQGVPAGAVPNQAAPSQTPSATATATAAEVISDEDLPEAGFWDVEPPEDLDWSADDDTDNAADNDGRPDDDPGDPLGPGNDDPGGGPGGDPGGDDAGSAGPHGVAPGGRDGSGGDDGDGDDDDDGAGAGVPGGADRTEPAAPPPLIEPQVGTDEQVALDPLPRPCLLDPAWLATMLQRLATEPVVQRDLRSSSYRVPGRIRRFIELRDRTCTFAGCTVPGRWCDADHREPWPLGPTDRENCHCVCRRHHRAKQAYFDVALDSDTGDTLWTTPDGRTYRRPPPTF